MRNQKKGWMTPELMIVILICLVVGAVAIHLVLKSSGPAGEFIGSHAIAAQSNNCRLQTERAANLGTSYNDEDHDGYADTCDICYGGVNQEDADLDGMPDACDRDFEDPEIFDCEYIMMKDEEQFNNICCTAPGQTISASITCQLAS